MRSISLARRFSIIGTEYNFMVRINGEPVEITDRDYFHKLQYLWYYGEEGEKYIRFCNSEKLEHKEQREEKIEAESEADAGVVGYQVTGWIGTAVGSGDLKDGEDNLNKIVIMVRGKLAQEDILEDFTEGGLYTKYLIGEIHADFLDIDDQEERSKKMLETQNIRVVLYSELIEDAYRSYQAFLEKNKEADRVYQLIQNIENS